MLTGDDQGPGREWALDDLGTRVVGRYIRWHESVPSTNDIAARLAEIPVPEGTVIGAEEQTAGRGRWGRSWASPRGGVWLSVILRPGLPPDRTPVVGLAAAVAAAEAIRETTRLPARVKWPNDVLVEGRKVVGILAEAIPGAEWVVVGVGINANVPQEALPRTPGYPAASLQALLGRPVGRGALIRVLLRRLDRGGPSDRPRPSDGLHGGALRGRRGRRGRGGRGRARDPRDRRPPARKPRRARARHPLVWGERLWARGRGWSGPVSRGAWGGVRDPRREASA